MRREIEDMQSPIFCDECGAANPAQTTTCKVCQQPILLVSAGSGLRQPVQNQSIQVMQRVNSGPLAAATLLEGRYAILEQVGAGGFGRVYRARDQGRAGGVVAVKQIQLARLSAREIIQATDSYNRETTLQPFLKHRGVPRVHSYFTDAANWYLVMDYVEGETLEERLKALPGGKLSGGEVLAIGIQLCAILHYLHSQNIIFRDVKPSNIMLSKSGRVYLIDFGIARRFDPSKTRDTVPLGSPGYAAPEQYGTAQSSERTDIYGLGMTLLALSTGKDLAECPLAEALADPALSPALRATIAGMVVAQPALRPASISNVKRRLLTLQSALPERRRYNLQRFFLAFVVGSSFQLLYALCAFWSSSQIHYALETHNSLGNEIYLDLGLQCLNMLMFMVVAIVGGLGLLQTFGPQHRRWQGWGLLIGVFLSTACLIIAHLWPIY